MAEQEGYNSDPDKSPIQYWQSFTAIVCDQPLNHDNFQCSVWPAFCSKAPTWPAGG